MGDGGGGVVLKDGRGGGRRLSGAFHRRRRAQLSDFSKRQENTFLMSRIKKVEDIKGDNKQTNKRSWPGVWITAHPRAAPE